MGLYFCSLDVFWPIFTFFDQSRCIHTTFFEFYNFPQHTEATVKDNNHSLGKHWLQNTKQQSNYFPFIAELWDDLRWGIFAFYQLYCQRMPDKEQHTVWYSFPKGQGFLGMNIHPGQLYLLVHVLMDSPKQLTQLGVNCSVMLVFHASNI